MSKSKNLFLKISKPLELISGISWLQKISGRKIILPLYHTVNEVAPAHLKYLYQPRSPKQFEDDLNILLKHFEPVDLEKIIQSAKSEKEIKKPLFHITFDDGLREFYEIAAPILIKKGIPATCFLNNEFIDNRNMLFRFKASVIIDHLHSQPAGSEAWKMYHQWIKKFEISQGYYRRQLLGISYGQAHLLDELAKMLHVDYDQYLNTHQPYMSSAQVNELIGKGFTFGAHTKNHPDLNVLSENEQVNEIRESMNLLNKKFTLKNNVFSFPFTDHKISGEVFAQIQAEDICELTFGCAGIKGDSARGNLQRIPVELTPLNMKTLLKKEFLYHIFLKLSGKGMITRS